VIPAPTANHPYCFRLEPKQQTQQQLRPWIIECKSEMDMDNWVAAIKTRIMKYTPVSSPSSLIFSPALSPKQSNRSTIQSIDSLVVAAPEFYRMPALPLRCTNLTKEEAKKDSLLMRRNKKLAPIVTLSSPQHNDVPLSSASSCSSLIPSPTGAVLGPLLNSPCNYSRSNISTTSNNTKGEQECDTLSLESSSSPTYLMYKKKFRL
jgi:hypothetical protein